MITSVLKYQKDSQYKSKYLLSALSAPYEPLQHITTKGEIPLYLSTSRYICSSSGRAPAFTLSATNSRHITGVFLPDLNRPNKGFGDHAEDGLLVQHEGNELSLVVISNARYVIQEYWSIWADNDPMFLDQLQHHLENLKFPDMLFNKG